MNVSVNDKSVHDKRLDTLKHQLHDELVDEEGNSPETQDVDDVVTAVREHLADAPLQDFVPLLVEHEARDELRRRGLHRKVDTDEGTDGPPSPDEDNNDSQRRLLEWKTTPHL
jgi:hypothetical protein